MGIGKEFFPVRVWIAERGLLPTVTDLELSLNMIENTWIFLISRPPAFKTRVTMIPHVLKFWKVTFKQKDQSNTTALVNLFTTGFPDELFNIKTKEKILT